MSDFWYGVVCTITAYAATGWLIGNIFVFSHLAHYFSAGWRVDWMFRTVWTAVLLWPGLIVEWYGEAQAKKAAARDAEMRSFYQRAAEPIDDSWQDGIDESIEDPPATIWYGEVGGRHIMSVGEWPRHDGQHKYTLDRRDAA